MRPAPLVALAAVAGTLTLPGAEAPAARSTSVGVGLREFGLSLYRDRVRPGVVKLNVTNFGEDVHDVVIRTRRGRVVGRTRDIRPGELVVKRIRLRRPGRYVAFCSIADHEQLGMRARLTVRRPRRA